MISAFAVRFAPARQTKSNRSRTRVCWVTANVARRTVQPVTDRPARKPEAAAAATAAVAAINPPGSGSIRIDAIFYRHCRGE